MLVFSEPLSPTSPLFLATCDVRIETHQGETEEDTHLCVGHDLEIALAKVNPLAL